MKRQRPALRLKFYILMLTIMSIPFQNCGDVRVGKFASVAPPPPKATANSVSYLRIDTNSTKTFRAAFLVDMSNSMFSGTCPDSLDTLLDINPAITPSTNCISPSGVDPDGKRFQVIIQWLENMKSQVAESKGKLTEDQFKILLVPFSMTPVPLYAGYGSGKDFWALDGTLLKKLIADAGIAIPAGRQFVSLDNAIKIIYILWAMDNRFHQHPYASQIPAQMVTLAEGAFLSTQNAYPSSGTSQPAPGMEIMINQLSAELTDLKTQNKIAGSHFELVFLSDGVPKPHPLHIEAMIKMIWNIKTSVCDPAGITSGQSTCADGSNNTLGWKTVTGAKNCATACKPYIQQYIDTGAVQLAEADNPTCVRSTVSCGWNGYCWNSGCDQYSDGASESARWGAGIKCGQCMELLNQFDYAPSGSRSGLRWSQNHLRTAASATWGDWTLNRHPYIIQKLKTMQNMFNLQFAGAQWRFNFIRVDSDIKENKTQAGELLKDLNWMVKAEDYYKKTQRFDKITTPQVPFELFYEVSRDQEYSLGVIYAYNRTYHLNSSGSLVTDSSSKRSDGVCLDSIKARFSECIQPPACDSAINADGDGLNQCEETTLGTNDTDPDSDGDGIADGAEILFGFNPLTNDRNLSSPIDHQSNFDHFVKGAPALVDLSQISKEKLIDMSTQLFDYKYITTTNGSSYRSLGYNVVLKNIPLKPNTENEIVVITRADNLSSPNDSRWLSKIYKVNSLSGSFEIKIEDFTKLNLESP